jgi:Co/Zn/Cd efflux system component
MMYKTEFEISKMDCPSEENLIRMKIEHISAIEHLEFDISKRKLIVFHTDNIERIEQSILELNIGSKRVSTEPTEQTNFDEGRNHKKLLWQVLIINFGFFLIEITTGFISNSMGLIADSLDMLSDSIVYGMSLFAAGGSIVLKKRVAKMAGYFQLILALLGLTEVVRRFFGLEQVPDFAIMIYVSIFALIGNALSLIILQKTNSKEAHIRASMIFTSNDIIINVGVITAGVLVNWSQSSIPDLVIGIIIFLIVVQGAIRILKLR